VGTGADRAVTSPAATTVVVMAGERPSRREVVESTAEVEAAMPPQRVPVNVYEAPGALVILAPLPAVTAGDVTIELRGSTLRFWAHLRSAGPRTFLVEEWSYGGYEREIEVPAGYGSAVEATLTNGQLAIRVLRGEPVGDVTVHPNAPGG
jgi:HSP20 family molecular chaperone IbpA